MDYIQKESKMQIRNIESTVDENELKFKKPQTNEDSESKNDTFVSKLNTPKTENDSNKSVDIQNEANNDEQKRQFIEYESECKDVTKCAAVHRMVTELSAFAQARESREINSFEYSQLLSDYHHTIECHLSEFGSI